MSNLENYASLYKKSIEFPNDFWFDISKQFYWRLENDNKILDFNFDRSKGEIYIKWFDNAVTNICYNVIDRVVMKGFGHRIAYYWENNDGESSKKMTYIELNREICKFSNGLRRLGIVKGDRITIYMAMSIQMVVAMLACARIGAVHVVVFAGFSSEALAERIMDSKSKLIITSNGCYRAEKIILLKEIADSALLICEKSGHHILHKIIHDHIEDEKGQNNFISIHDLPWNEFIKNEKDYCEPEWLNAEDELFVIYTSGSTGKPKGVVHTIGGYLLYSYLTFKYVFNYTDGDIFFSTADLGWMAAHTFSVYGALANAASIVLMEGTPLYPRSDRIFEIINRLKVNIFYTSPTVIRLLKRITFKYFQNDSLKVLGAAGEPINYQIWLWYWRIFGGGRCPVVDTYWQTETGGPMIVSLPGFTPMKPGAAGLPFFGVSPAVLDVEGKELEGECEGNLVFSKPWPGLARTINGSHSEFEKNYFQKFENNYTTGDGVKRDKDGYYFLTGRTDEMLNVSGHLMSTLQLENIIVEHQAIDEAAVVSVPHPIKGQTLIVFVVRNSNDKILNPLEYEIKGLVRDRIGSFAEPEKVFSVTSLPKTRSGKIMRRILQKISRNDPNIGDISTLMEESSILELKNLNFNQYN